MHLAETKKIVVHQQGPHVLKLANMTTNPYIMWPDYILCVIKLRTRIL